MSERTTPRDDMERAWNNLMRRFGYGCDECDDPMGFCGTVSCSNCGHIPEEHRA